MADPADRPEVHLRMLIADDAEWVVATDHAAATALARHHGWEVDELTQELDEGQWASDDRWAWAVIVDGEPGGFALVTDLMSNDAAMTIRIHPKFRGRGVAREVLRQLAEHHFSDDPQLNRLTGRAHEHNIPMQRVFNAAGFRMEARFRDTIPLPDGGFAAEWGYALTRADWEAGLHRADDEGYDLHGLTFVLDNDGSEPQQMEKGSLAKFLQEGRRVLISYGGGHVSDGEGAGVLVGDSLRYRYVHTWQDHETVKGWGRSRVQRRKDGRLEIVDEFETDEGTAGRHVWVERR